MSDQFPRKWSGADMRCPTCNKYLPDRCTCNGPSIENQRQQMTNTTTHSPSGALDLDHLLKGLPPLPAPAIGNNPYNVRQMQEYGRKCAEVALARAGQQASESPTVADYEATLADNRRLVRELDVLLNGEAGAAKQASLCDIVAQVSREGIKATSPNVPAQTGTGGDCLPRWIDDLKGKDPTIDSLIEYIIDLGAVGAKAIADLRAQLASVLDDATHQNIAAAKVWRERDQLRAQLASAQKDAERLDFLDTNARFKMGWKVAAAPVGNLSVQSIIRGGTPIRDAIDAARAQLTNTTGN